jgi:hypothetical protein
VRARTAVLACAAVAVASGCGGGPDTQTVRDRSKSDYAVDLSDFTSEYVFELGLVEDASSRDELAGATEAAVDATDTYQGVLAELDPPDAVAGLHERLTGDTEQLGRELSDLEQEVVAGDTGAGEQARQAILAYEQGLAELQEDFAARGYEMKGLLAPAFRE